MSEPDIARVMMQAMQAEDQRRQVASASPGLCALLPLPQPPSGPSVGKAGLDLPVIGEGYEIQAEIAAAVHKAYGEARPVYAGPEVAGDSVPAGRLAARATARDRPRRRWPVHRGRRRAAADAFTVVSPPARPSLLARLLGRLRRGQ